MRSSTLTKSIGLFSALVFAVNTLAAGANKIPNLITDKVHITGETASKLLSLDASKQVKSTTYTPTLLDDVVNATDANTPSTIVKRDASGNFTAGTITANLNGTALSALPRWNYTAQTSNYTAVAGDWVDASGSSFNITLPDATAANISGKPIYVSHSGVSLSNVYTILTTGGQTITGAPNNTAYTSGQVALYTNNEGFEFWPTGTGWKIRMHKSDTSWTSAGSWIQYYTFTVSAAAATLAAVYSPAQTFTLVAAGSATAAATYVPSYVWTVSAAAATAAATYQPAWVYTVTAANATVGAVYKDANGASYTVAATIAGATTLVTTGTATPPASGTLTFFSGTGDPAINYSVVAGNPSNQGTYTVSTTIAAGTTLTTTSTASLISNSSGRLVKLAGTGDAVIQYTNVAGQPSNTGTCTVSATIAAATSLVQTCTATFASTGTLTKLAGTGDLIIPYNAIVGDDTAGGTRTFRVAQTIAAGTTLITQGEAALPPLGASKLGKISGTGDTVITYSAVSGNPNTVTFTTAAANGTFFGAPTVNSWEWRRVDGEYVEVHMKFSCPTAGVNGTGDMVFTMPANLVIDTTKAPTQTTPLGGQAEVNSTTPFRIPMSGTGDVQATNYTFFTHTVPWSSTQFRMFMLWSITAGIFQPWGASFFTINQVIAVNVYVKFPIQGWLPN